MPPQFAGLVLAAVAYRAPAQGTPPLQPATYHSPSAEWTLEVDPTSRFGAGSGNYLATRSDEPVWAKQLPFTLREACIDDRGFVAGYGYDQGWNGITPIGNFVIAVVSPHGEVLGQHSWPMRMSPAIHGSPEPWVHESILDQQRGEVVFRTETSQGQDSFEEWCIVELHSGRLVDRYRPDERVQVARLRGAEVIDMLPIPMTPLNAVTWRTSIDPDDSSAEDLCITVLGPDGKPVATLDLPKELDVVGRPGRNLWQEMWRRGNLLAVERDGGFAVWLPNSALRVDYGVKRLPGESQWLIEELDRTPYEPPEEPLATDPPNEPIELALLERVALECKPSTEPSPIRDIEAFGWAGPGKLQVVRCDDPDSGVFTCLLIDEQGNVLAERRIDPLSGGQQIRWKWWPLGESRWLVTPGFFSTQQTPESILVDASDVDPLRRIPLHLDRFESVASGADGGFVVLAGASLTSYDRTGTSRWSKWLDGEINDPMRLFGADDVAVSPSGVVAVVDPWQDALALFGTDGELVARLELAELWDHDPDYVATIAADGNDGFLLVENPSSPTVQRIGLDGRIRSSFVPRYTNGAKDDSLPRNVQRGIDGALWTTDGRALLRLGEDGQADLVLGQAQVAEDLDEPRTAAIDPLGRVVLFDQSTRAVHAFDGDGTRLFVAVPQPQDYEGDYSEGGIVGSFDGRLFVQTQAFEQGWLGFDPNGNRLGPLDLGGRSEIASLDDLAFTPGGPFWLHRAQDGELATLRDEQGDELLRLERRADHRWFEALKALAVARSGQLAVLEDLEFSGGGASVSWFDARGRPLGQLQLSSAHPGDSVAFSGDWIAVESHKAQAIWLAQTSTARLSRMVPPPGWIGAVGFSPDGHELWLVQPGERVLWRYGLP